MREKLIELIKTGISECWRPVEGYAELVVEDLADYLIDHGVTIQRWIPVEERLPKRTSDYMVYLSTPMDGKQVPIGRGVATYITADECWAIHYPYIVTHWMPLPEPPKEVE